MRHESGKTKGDEFYFAAKIHLGDRLFANARELPDGAVSPAHFTERRDSRALRMVKNKRPVPFDFAEGTSAGAERLSQDQAIERS